MQLVTQTLMTPDGYLPQTQVLPQLSDTWCLETTRFAEANGKEVFHIIFKNSPSCF